MIKSLLDTDLYKFTMQQAVLHNFPDAIVKYKFKCRNQNADFSKAFPMIQYEIKKLNGLSATKEELDYLKTFRFFKQDYIDFLKIYRMDSEYITCSLNGNDLDVTINGPWLYTILFEVPLLAIISELYYVSHLTPKEYEHTYDRALSDSIRSLKQAEKTTMKIAEFGTRRRYSHKLQDKLIASLINYIPNNFIGTSNLYFAKRYNLKAIGTMAHEWLQACQAVGPRLRDSQYFALNSWANEYRGDLGIALSDVIGMNAFLKDFDLFFCKLFDGVRHDSGNPYDWCEKLIEHYEKMNIDPKTKHAVFSDGLTVKTALELHQTFNHRINVSSGIGTSLTCNLRHFDNLKIVLKMVECNGQPVAKISDEPNKNMCEDSSYIEYLKSVFN